MSSKEQLQAYYNFLISIVKEAGEYFLQSGNESIEVEYKTPHELVTKYDKNIENTLVDRIKAKYPNHKIIGEEGNGSTKQRPILTNDPTWIIDPIDGTTNFAHKIPLCGISVGLTINKEQVLGVVFIPFLGELYGAIKDQGAYLNGEKISCSKITDPNKSLFCYEIGTSSKSDELHKLVTKRLDKFTKEVLSLRCFGCPVLSQCYVASGKLDGYQGDGLEPWDAAAGTLIVKEAGGYVVGSDGKPFDLMKSNFLVAATKELAENYLKINKSASQDRNIKIN